MVRSIINHLNAGSYETKEIIGDIESQGFFVSIACTSLLDDKIFQQECRDNRIVVKNISITDYDISIVLKNDSENYSKTFSFVKF